MRQKKIKKIDTAIPEDISNVETDDVVTHIIIRDIEDPNTSKKIKVFIYHVNEALAISEMKKDHATFEANLSNVIKENIISNIKEK